MDRVSDFAKNDTTFHIRTHLGHLLNAGDYALGYDLHGANSNDGEVEKHKGLVLPVAILIKKSYEERCQKERGSPVPRDLMPLTWRLIMRILLSKKR